MEWVEVRWSAAADKVTGAKYQEGGLVESDSESEIKKAMKEN